MNVYTFTWISIKILEGNILYFLKFILLKIFLNILFFYNNRKYVWYEITLKILTSLILIIILPKLKMFAYVIGLTYLNFIKNFKSFANLFYFMNRTKNKNNCYIYNMAYVFIMGIISIYINKTVLSKWKRENIYVDKNKEVGDQNSRNVRIDKNKRKIHGLIKSSKI